MQNNGVVLCLLRVLTHCLSILQSWILLVPKYIIRVFLCSLLYSPELCLASLVFSLFVSDPELLETTGLLTCPRRNRLTPFAPKILLRFFLLLPELGGYHLPARPPPGDLNETILKKITNVAQHYTHLGPSRRAETFILVNV